ncbi:ribonuclease Z [Candidatus Poribacteria bacterium]|nr:ribonuclease Z [Candidatus Poribacteria bacterium]
MRIIFLGTTSGVPTKERRLSATAVVYNGELFLFDCGEGTQMQIRKVGLRWGALNRIFISHLHGDHIIGLLGVLMSLQVGGRDSPIFLYGPTGLEEYVQMSIRLMQARIRYELVIKEITPAPFDKGGVVSGGVICDEKNYYVACAPLEHRIFTLGYALVEKDKPGKFNVEKAEQLGIPEGPIRTQIQRGEEVVLDNGTRIFPDDILGPPRKGRRIAYCLDTSPGENAEKLASEADVLIYDGTFFSDEHQTLARKTGHSTWREAAELARKAGVKKLVLTHFSPRYTALEKFLPAFQTIFPEIILASDLMEIEVDIKENT